MSSTFIQVGFKHDSSLTAKKVQVPKNREGWGGLYTPQRSRFYSIGVQEKGWREP